MQSLSKTSKIMLNENCCSYRLLKLGTLSMFQTDRWSSFYIYSRDTGKKINIEWVSDCCLTPIQQFFSYMMVRTMRWYWGPLCTRPTNGNMLSCIFIGLPNWRNSPWIDMSPHSDTLFWFWVNQYLFFLLNAACLAEKQQIPIL
jgi:hypothetical protein